MLGMFGIRIMSENQLLNGYANGITPNVPTAWRSCRLLKLKLLTQPFNGNFAKLLLSAGGLFSSKLQSKYGNFLFFLCGGRKLFLLKINDLENNLKITAKKFVYIIYLMYICIIKLKQRKNGIHSKTNRKR